MPIAENAVTREELYLAKAAGQDVTLPEKPLTRRELYLAKIAGQDVELPENPITREEQYLAYIAEHGSGGGDSGGGGGGDQSTNKLTLFLNNTLTEITADDFGDMTEVPTGRISGYSGYANGVYSSTVGAGSPGGFQNVKAITFPETVTKLSNYVCWHLNYLEKVTFTSGNMTNFAMGVFAYCSNLKEVIFAENTANNLTFASSVFLGCTSLEKITIPSGTKQIGQNVFYNSTNLKEVHMRQDKPPTLSNTSAFYGVSSELVIYVPKGSLEAYQTATNWSSFAEKMQEE